MPVGLGQFRVCVCVCILPLLPFYVSTTHYNTSLGHPTSTDGEGEHKWSRYPCSDRPEFESGPFWVRIGSFGLSFLQATAASTNRLAGRLWE